MEPSYYVPGEFKCPKCSFALTKSTLFAESGNVQRNVEKCPNDGEILRPVRYDEALAEARAQAVKGMLLARKLKVAIEKWQDSWIPIRVAKELLNARN